MNVLEVRSLSKSFGGVRAVNDVSFDIAQGEFLAMIGPNGAGKSTCFNMINGQLKPDSGKILFEGRDIAGLEPREIWRLGVGRTFQVAATFGSMTVSENVQMALISHARETYELWRPAADLHRDRALDLLAQVGMREAADRPSRELAYGDIKRVELAIALANEPRLLLMDEPTAGMAPRERNELIALVKRLVVERARWWIDNGTPREWEPWLRLIRPWPKRETAGFAELLTEMLGRAEASRAAAGGPDAPPEVPIFVLDLVLGNVASVEDLGDEAQREALVAATSRAFDHTEIPIQVAVCVPCETSASSRSVPASAWCQWLAAWT